MDTDVRLCHRRVMRRALAVITLTLAAAVVVVMALAGFGLTREYGPDPNGGGFWEAARGVAGPGLLLGLFVAGLVALGTKLLGRPVRLPLVVGSVAVTVAALAGAVLLGAQR